MIKAAEIKDLSSRPTPITDSLHIRLVRISETSEWIPGMDYVRMREKCEQFERERAVLINALKIAREYIDGRLDETRIAYGNRLMHKQKAIEADLKIADDAIALIESKEKDGT